MSCLLSRIIHRKNAIIQKYRQYDFVYPSPAKSIPNPQYVIKIAAINNIAHPPIFSSRRRYRIPHHFCFSYVSVCIYSTFRAIRTNRDACTPLCTIRNAHAPPIPKRAHMVDTPSIAESYHYWPCNSRRSNHIGREHADLTHCTKMLRIGLSGRSISTSLLSRLYILSCIFHFPVSSHP